MWASLTPFESERNHKEGKIMKNLAKILLTETERDQIDALFDQIEALLEKKLPVLSEDERSRYGSINEQNKLLVNKTRDNLQADASKMSPDVDWTEFEDDYQARQWTERAADRSDSLAYRLRGAKILHDYDNYNDSLDNYSYAQYRKGAGVEGYAEIVAEYKQFFPRTKKNQPPEGKGDTE